jgi:inner membrane protein
MDTITHSLLGACLGEIIAGKKFGKRAMLYGALANNIPDIDVISAFWSGETEFLLLHRGITHSLLAAILVPPLLALLFEKLYRARVVSYSQWLVIFMSGMLLHVFTDACTTYGTGLLEPFSDKRFSFNTIFILDPLFSIPVLTATLALLFLKRESKNRIRWAITGFTLSCLYLAFTWINKSQINHIAEKNLKAAEPDYLKFMTAPTPLNNFLWYVLAEYSDHFLFSYYSVFDKTTNMTFSRIERNESILKDVCNKEELKNLLKFSDGYFNVEKDSNIIVFNDLRYGRMGGWNGEKAAFVFNFRLLTNCDAKKTVERGGFSTNGVEALKQLYNRINGRDTSSEVTKPY